MSLYVFMSQWCHFINFSVAQAIFLTFCINGLMNEGLVRHYMAIDYLHWCKIQSTDNSVVNIYAIVVKSFTKTSLLWANENLEGLVCKEALAVKHHSRQISAFKNMVKALPLRFPAFLLTPFKIDFFPNALFHSPISDGISLVSNTFNFSNTCLL